MDKVKQRGVAIIAGASGLVGNELLKQLLQEPDISQVYALVRTPLHYVSPKLIQLQHQSLTIADWNNNVPVPDIGFICLGTTLKQAGSKAALAKVDYELVVKVAKEMRQIGVNRIAIISSLGASPSSLSHYLRCKGKMEQEILTLGFKLVVFMRPGPLAGHRTTKRKNELYVNRLLRLLDPFLFGYLANFRPIPAASVARVMLYVTMQSQNNMQPQNKLSGSYMAFNSVQISTLMERYTLKPMTE